MLSRFRFWFFAFAAVALFACNTHQPDNQVYNCTGNCIVVFGPDSATIARLRQSDNAEDFNDALEHHLKYAKEFEQHLNDSTIQYHYGNTRYITINNGKTKKQFDTHTADDIFGVILVKQNAEPVIHRGLFSDLEYDKFKREYFGR
jgi:hypothetical protein